MIAVGGRGSSIDKSFYPGFFGSEEHLDKTSHVDVGGGHGIYDASGHTAQGGLVEDVVATGDGFLAVVVVADIAFDEGIVFMGKKPFNILAVAGHEVIEAHYLIALIKQHFREVGADEACSSCDEDG